MLPVQRCATDMYGPGKPFSALKQRQVSSTRTGPPILPRASMSLTALQWDAVSTYDCGSSPTLVLWDFFNGALDLDQIEGTTSQWDSVSEDDLNFGQLIWIAGDEV